MEPVKGGNLAHIPSDLEKLISDFNDGSLASFAIRFAAGFEGVYMVLSGMSNLVQMKDNLSFMKDFKPLSEEEKKTVFAVAESLRNKGTIPCTSCHYCTAVCRQKIAIPELFACYNQKLLFGDWNSNFYHRIYTQGAGKASDCLKCGKCESVCPQHLKIRNLLELVSGVFEK